MKCNHQHPEGAVEKRRCALFAPVMRPIEPFWAGATLTEAGFDQGTLMSSNMYLRITSEGRLFGLNSGDWMMLLGGFALVALVVLLL